MKSLLSATLAAIASLVITVSPASAAASHRIASCHAHGTAAVCLVRGTAVHPRTIYAHVTSAPRQRVLVRWHMTCSKGTSVRRSHGHFRARTPIRRLLHHPFQHPGSCVVTARTRLPGTGRLHLWLTTRR